MAQVLLGVDVGKARIGIARSDALGMLATPLETVPRTLPQLRAEVVSEQEVSVLAAAEDTLVDSSDVQRIAELAAEYAAQAVYVGLPLNLEGERTPSTVDAEFFAQVLARVLRSKLDIPVRLVDERLSTKTAQQQLQQAGRRGKAHRAVIDQAAAVVILQQVLDMLSYGREAFYREVGSREV